MAITSSGILDEGRTSERDELVALLTTAYWMEIEFTQAIDPVTQDMVVAILRDEQKHRRLFEGFLREYEAEGRG